MNNNMSKKEDKSETILQSIIDKFNFRLDEKEKTGYDKKVKDNLIAAIKMRDGLIDAYHDPECYDKEDIKYEIIEFTKIIIRHNNIAQAKFNPQIIMESVEDQLKEAMQTDKELVKIFKTKN